MKLMEARLRNIFFLSTVKNMVSSVQDKDSLEVLQGRKVVCNGTNHPEKLVQSFLIVSCFFSSLWETND